MAGFKQNLFSGVIPRLPESLLPEPAATIAHNCDFAYGELRNTKGGLLIGGMSNAPASIYTEDGLSFYTWTTDVNAVRSPVVNDTFGRVYYTDGSAMKVALRAGMRVNGGPPGSSYQVGVPRPAQPPRLTVQIPDVSNAAKYALAFRFHYELGGVKYQEQAVTPAALGGGRYQFTPPTRSRMVSYANFDGFPEEGVAGTVYKADDSAAFYTWGGSAYVPTTGDATPAQAFPVLRVTCTVVEDGSQLFDSYSENSGFKSTGGIWAISLANDPNAASFTATLTAAIKEADKVTRAYVITYVNTYGEEGPPSQPAKVDTAPLVDVSLTAVLDATGGYAPIKEIRIYRTPDDSAVSAYFYAGKITTPGGAPGNYPLLDSVKGVQLNEELSSFSFLPPPSGLQGLMQLPNGILMAGKGNELWFSEPYKPWAWPPEYVKVLPSNLTGGIAVGSGAVVTTTTTPYLVSGVASDAMTTTKLNVDQAGVSKWSIAVVDGLCMFASHDGLVVVNGASASLAQSQRLFTREKWRELYGAGLGGMRFAVWDGRLVAFSATGAFTPFMIRFDEADGKMTELPGFQASCAFVSPVSDQFYYAWGTALYQFNGGTAQAAVWQSAERVLARPINYGIAQALVEGNWSFELWAYDKNMSTGQFEYRLKHTQALGTGLHTFRLPGGFRSDRYRIKLTGTGRFRELRVAQAGAELAEL